MRRNARRRVSEQVVVTAGVLQRSMTISWRRRLPFHLLRNRLPQSIDREGVFPQEDGLLVLPAECEEDEHPFRM